MWVFPDILKDRFAFIFKRQAGHEFSSSISWPWGLFETSGSTDPTKQRHGVAYRKTRILICTAVRTSNLALNEYYFFFSEEELQYSVSKVHNLWVLQDVESIYLVTFCNKRLIEYMGEFTFFIALNYVYPGCWQVHSPTRKETSRSDQTNFCKPLKKKKILKVVRPTRSPLQQWHTRRTKSSALSIVFSVGSG